MIVGKREETIMERIKRHTKEAEQQIECWENELAYAQTQDDEEGRKYQEHCEFMIQVWKNTLEKLKNFEID